MKLALKKMSLAFALAGVMAGAQATVLLPNDTSSEVGIVDAPFGGILLDSAISRIQTISFDGFVRAAVYRAESGLDFYYQFSSSCCKFTGGERLTGFSFAALGFSPVEVFQVQNPFGIFAAGTRASDYADRTIQGEIGFNFLPVFGAVFDFTPIISDIASFTQVVRTHATTYAAGTVDIFNVNGHVDSVRAFAPSVPEPETYAMLLAGLGMLATIMRRRSANLSARAGLGSEA